jgi:zinc transporter, ZIP family
MPVGTIILLGAFAGLTIYLGLPLACLRQTSASLKAFLSMLATGVLIFLLYDVIGKASEPIGEALDQIRTQHAGTGSFFLDVLLLALGIGFGSVGLVYFNSAIFGRVRPLRSATPKEPEEKAAVPQPVPVGAEAQDVAEAVAGFDVVQPAPARPQRRSVTAAGKELAPQTLALIIATGIGLHNFSEGLAIGQSAAAGALQLAIVLIIGFGLHNMTEGFGIAGPLTGQSTPWRFIGLLGLIGGGPTFLGTVVGILFNSPQVFIFFLALAAGAIIYVLGELFGAARRLKAPEIAMWGLLIGFLLGYATDLIVTFAGA